MPPLPTTRFTGRAEVAKMKRTSLIVALLWLAPSMPLAHAQNIWPEENVPLGFEDSWYDPLDPQLARVTTVVLDPGHGGIDPGAEVAAEFDGHNRNVASGPREPEVVVRVAGGLTKTSRT